MNNEENLNVYSFNDECYVSLKDYKQLKQQYEQLKINWDKLKNDLELVVDYGLGDESSKWDKIYGEYAKSTLKFMQELEKVKENEKNKR